MADPPDDPAAQVRTLVAAARLEFARDVDAVLLAYGAPQSGFDGEAVQALRRFILAKFDQRVAMRPTVDPVLLRLFREAFEIINDRDSQIDRREWTKEARKVLQEG